MMIACKLMLGSHRMMTSEAQFPNPPAISSNSPPTLRIPDRSGHPVLHRLVPLAGKALPLPLDTAPLIRALEGL